MKTSDGLVSFDKDMRAPVTLIHLAFGIVLLPVGGLGIVFLVVALPQLVKLIGMIGARKRMFYGHDRTEARRLRKQLPVRM